MCIQIKANKIYHGDNIHGKDEHRITISEKITNLTFTFLYLYLRTIDFSNPLHTAGKIF